MIKCIKFKMLASTPLFYLYRHFNNIFISILHDISIFKNKIKYIYIYIL